MLTDVSPLPATLLDRFTAVRAATESLCAPLVTEDYVVSSMSDVSPTKWHLAHTSWFFETFLLAPHDPGYTPLNPRYAFLFNSYYVQAGERHCRAQRGLVTRPTVDEVYAYRAYINEAVQTLCDRIAGDVEHPAWQVVELGLHHEQQHQELLLTDIKHVFWTNPMRPSYRTDAIPQPPEVAQGWQSIAEGVYRIGHDGDGFAFDNEGPRHGVYLAGARIANRLVTNAEYAAFIADGGYRKTALWLSAGWAAVQSHHWQAPLYWELVHGSWHEYTVAGTAPIIPYAPVTHLSYYEADAYARWAGGRLPTEAEWEVVAADAPVTGRFVEHGVRHPFADARSGLQQLFGDTWQWTQSPYVGYPGFRTAPGAIGEYNGKWMSDQWVLRGASCATPESHARVTYRNFFPSDARWQFTGIRLAADA
ncbi:ergothioneine biosynthesis protein EgtB [Gemmatimonas sp.]|uniref:ergothioneine biosynthesis protein EgtB n=1 Tax=Gemmatimonas sp. TaxID=1962908 RepID=UPI0039833D01